MALGVDKIITLLAVAFGWLLNEMSTALRLRREDRRAIGPVLTDLLEIRYRIFALDFTMAELKRHLPIPTEAEVPLRQVLDRLIPEPPRLLERYDEAVSIVARADPLLAFRLGGQAMVKRVLSLLRGLAASDQAASKMWGTVAEPELLRLFKPHFDELILDVARTHGFVTKWRTQRHLKMRMELPPEVQHWISSLASTSQAATPVSDPTPTP